MSEVGLQLEVFRLILSHTYLQGVPIFFLDQFLSTILVKKLDVECETSAMAVINLVCVSATDGHLN